jgi:hypothetical protein
MQCANIFTRGESLYSHWEACHDAKPCVMCSENVCSFEHAIEHYQNSAQHRLPLTREQIERTVGTNIMEDESRGGIDTFDGIDSLALGEIEDEIMTTLTSIPIIDPDIRARDIIRDIITEANDDLSQFEFTQLEAVSYLTDIEQKTESCKRFQRALVAPQSDIPLFPGQVLSKSFSLAPFWCKEQVLWTAQTFMQSKVPDSMMEFILKFAHEQANPNPDSIQLRLPSSIEEMKQFINKMPRLQSQAARDHPESVRFRLGDVLANIAMDPTLLEHYIFAPNKNEEYVDEVWKSSEWNRFFDEKYLSTDEIPFVLLIYYDDFAKYR